MAALLSTHRWSRPAAAVFVSCLASRFTCFLGLVFTSEHVDLCTHASTSTTRYTKLKERNDRETKRSGFTKKSCPTLFLDPHFPIRTPPTQNFDDSNSTQPVKLTGPNLQSLANQTMEIDFQSGLTNKRARVLSRVPEASCCHGGANEVQAKWGRGFYSPTFNTSRNLPPFAWSPILFPLISRCQPACMCTCAPLFVRGCVATFRRWNVSGMPHQ